MPTIKELAETLEKQAAEAEQWNQEYRKAQDAVEKTRAELIDALHKQTGRAHIDLPPEANGTNAQDYFKSIPVKEIEDPFNPHKFEVFHRQPLNGVSKKNGHRKYPDNDRKFRLYDYMKEKGGLLTVTEWKRKEDLNTDLASSDFQALAKLGKVSRISKGRYRLRRMPRQVQKEE